MDYTALLKSSGGKKSKVEIVGATRDYGYTSLAQIPKVDLMELKFISSRHATEYIEAPTGLGYSKDSITVCEDREQIRDAARDAVVIANDYQLVLESDITTLVECTGNTAVGSGVTESVLRRGANICMVSKKTDSVCGPVLNHTADQYDTVYSLVNKDQP